MNKVLVNGTVSTETDDEKTAMMAFAQAIQKLMVMDDKTNMQIELQTGGEFYRLTSEYGKL